MRSLLLYILLIMLINNINNNININNINILLYCSLGEECIAIGSDVIHSDLLRYSCYRKKNNNINNIIIPINCSH